MAATTAAEASARARVQELAERHPLPPGWTLSEIFLQETTVAQLRLCMVGLVGGREAGQALGSAAESDAYPVERAYFELLERISIQQALTAEALWVRDVHANALAARPGRRVFPPDPFPERLRLALSNGVALQAGWQSACAAARRELMERDRVLRSFAGEITPRPLPQPAHALCQALASAYRYAAYALGTPGEHVVIVCLWPHSLTNPLVYGFGAADDAAGALAGAEREALQRLAFLWGEALPEQAPEAAPTPDYHQEHYLFPPHHAQLLAWLEGDRAGTHSEHATHAAAFCADKLTFIDLTPAALSSSGLYVVKAVSPHARKLRFGGARGTPHPIV
jgi:hypothetical protein